MGDVIERGMLALQVVLAAALVALSCWMVWLHANEWMDCKVSSGVVVAKQYAGNASGWRLSITDGDRTRTVAVPEEVGRQAEPGDWYDVSTVKLEAKGAR